MKKRISFRTLEIAAVTLAVTAIAAGIIYWQMFRVTSPEITSKWLESGGIASVMAQLPDKKITPKEFATSTDEIAARKVGEEIVSLRTETAQVFKSDNPGEFKAKVYAAPINYLDKTDATYKPIDTTVHEIADIAKSNPEKQFDEYIDAGVYQATWFKDKPWDYKMFVGDSWIQYKALFDESSVLSIKIDKLNTGMKETITLKDATASTKLQWTVTQSGSGIITPPPTAIDANKKEVKVVSYQVGDTLTYEVDTTDAVFPIEVDPSSNINATNDGSVRNYVEGDYSTARYSTVGEYMNGSVSVGQHPSYAIYRGFVQFAIPDMITISAATLYLKCWEDYSTAEYNLRGYASTYSSSLTYSDYGNFSGSPLTDAWYSGNYSNSNYIAIPLTAGGRDAVLAKKNSIFKLALLSDQDYNATQPSFNEVITFASSAYGASNAPYLAITYTIAAPTVTTQSASSVSVTTATLNGNITETGSSAPTVRGFVWGTNSALSGGDTATTTENGSFGTGAFTNTALTFACNTTYYSRAYATNSSGTGLGAISASFTTSSCSSAPTVTTQSASVVTDTTATLNGNITNTGTPDVTVTVRGFAYGTDSTLASVISTTTDTTGQPFSTGTFTVAITGLTKGTNYYARAYATNSVGTGFGSIQALTSNLQSDAVIFRNNVILNNDVILK